MSEEQLIQTPGVFGETGNFLLERELGRGGMGGVYMGRDKMLDRPVAVKVMLKEYGADAEFVEKFKREAQAAAKLIHPNIAQIYSYGIAEGMPYIAMELVAGGSLDQLMKNAGSSIDIPRVMKICEQVAQALRCASDQGLVHGDVKPENVLLDANGNAKLVDFGLAAMQKDTDEIWGTPYYIAPEKVKKEPVDYRADMYSLGGTIYHALTGVAPFEGDDASAVVRKRFEGAPVPPSSLRPDISPQIDALVLKMLALNPADRFPSFEALLQEYGRVMATGLTAAPSGSGAQHAGTSAGGRKIVMKGRKRFKVRTSSEGEGEGETDARQPTRNAPPPEPEEGGVAGKVLGVIGLTIAAIGLVAGLLVWYVIADRNARERAKQEQIAGNIRKAREAIADVGKNALQFAEHCDELAAKSLKACQDPTDKLIRELSGKFDTTLLAGLKPGPTKELLDAIALTNIVEQASEVDTNALAAAAAPLANALGQAVQGLASNMMTVVAAASIPKFRPPNDDEADPASPEHEAYLKAKEAWEKEQREKMAREAEARKSAEAAAASSSQSAASAEPAQVSTDLSTEEGVKAAFEIQLREILSAAKRNSGVIWERAYGCQAASIRIRHKINMLTDKIAAFKNDGVDESAMQAIANFSVAIKDEFEQIKASDDVTTIQKGVSFIKSKGENAVNQTAAKILIATKNMERLLEKIRAAAEAAAHQAQAEKDKQDTIARDNEKIKEKFESLVSTGVFRQLDWKGAMRQLTAVKDEFKYSESQIYADVFIQKVKMMATVQEVFIANCKDYKFARYKLARFKISNINEKEIVLLKPDGKTQMKMTWVKFYQQYHGNLNELIVKFIEKGRNVSKLSDGKRLSLQPWADAMMGSALTMQVICGDDPTAPVRAEQIAKNAVKELPDYLNRAKAVFPEIQFEAVAEE